MALDQDNGDYLGSYQRFFEDFITNLNPLDQLPVKISGYDSTEGEIVGEIIDMTLQYLNQKFCPPSLQAHMVRLVIEEIKAMCRKQPEDCGLKPHENTYGPLKLMQAVTSKVNEICFRYLDNSRLALLPPPPSTPLPLATCYAIKNLRRKMEDRSVVLHDLNTMFSIKDDSLVNYYAVFDGHGGQDAAVYCAAHLHQYLVESIHYPTNPVLALRDAFQTTDARFIEKKLNSGSTAVVALLVNKTLYIAWAGDSQAALVKNGSYRQLVNPHKPERIDEKERVETMGGNVIHFGIWRVNGHLSVSRSIGDRQYKPFITGEPEVLPVPLDGTEDFLVVACDGFWDCVDEEKTAAVLYEIIERDPQNYKEASRYLVDLAKRLQSQDNISVIVVFLTHPTEIAAKLKRFRSSFATRMDPDSPQDVQLAANYNTVEAGSYPFEMNFGPRDEISAQHPGNIHAVDAGCCPYEMNFSKQQAPQHTNGSVHLDPENLIYEKSSNGKHANGSADYDDDEDEDDLGPETDVDAVDETSETVVPCEKISRELFPDMPASESDKFHSEEDKFQAESLAAPDLETESRQHELLPEADNVADSEDSEDEWNYYRVEPDKDKDSSVLVNEPSSESKEEKEVCSPKPLIEDDSEIEPLKEESNCNSKSDTEFRTPSPGLTDTECTAETRNPEEDFTFRKQSEHESELEDMEFHLNPDAKEFIPPSMFPQRMNVSDFPISGSPLKQIPTVMDDIPIPSESEFDEEISHRPSDIEDEGSPLSKPLDPEYKISLDDSEISSTKAEFGDESTTSFLTMSEFQRTGVSAMDCSFTGSDREDYDISKDPMAMSFTPGDFEAAFEKRVDLNAVHDLSDVDFSDNVNGVHDEEMKSPELESVEEKEEEISQENEPLSPFVLESPTETLERKSQNPFDMDILKETLKEENFESAEPSALETNHEEVQACLLNSNAVPFAQDVQEDKVSESENSQLLGFTQDVQEDKVSESENSQPLGFTQDVQEDKVSESENSQPLGFTQDVQEDKVSESENSQPLGFTQDVQEDKVSESENSQPLGFTQDVQEDKVSESENSQPLGFTQDVQEDKVSESENSQLLGFTQDVQEDKVTESENSQLLEDFSPEQNDVSPVPQDSAFGSSFDPVSQFGFQQPLLLETADRVAKSNQESVEAFENEEKVLENNACFFENKENVFKPDEVLEKEEEIPDFEPEVQTNDIEFDPEIQEKSQTKFELSLEVENLEEKVPNVEQFSDETDKCVPIETENIEANDIFEQKTNYAPVLNLSESQEFTGLERQVNEAKELENIVEYAQVTETTVQKENIDVEQKDVVEDVVNDNDLAREVTEKIEELKIEEPKSEEPTSEEPTSEELISEEPISEEPISEEPKSEVPLVAAAAAGAAVVAATTAAAKATKKPATTASKTSTTKTSTASKPTKSLPTSPTKTSTAARTTAAAAKKPSTTISRPKQLDTKPATGIASKTSTFKANPAPKTSTTATKITPRLSTAAPKPRTSVSSPKPASAAGDKKPTTNGEVKSLASKSTASKPAARPTSAAAPRTTLVKSSSTTRASSSTTAAAAPAKSRLVSTSTVTRTATRTATATTNRPKTAPATTGSTLGSARQRVPSAKSPMIDKQIKETANKQISSSRVSSVGATRTSRLSTATSTTSTTVKRTATLKAAATATSATSPTKKPAPISKNYKPLTKTSAKTAVTTTKKPVQNGNCEVKKIESVTTTTTTTTNIEEDVLPQKDISPIAPPTDNQLIMTSE